ncbi:hypothetical protein PhCBS80983_g05157 [Powellomyces hirtus]|uniref:F-box domain-containing protein n=1 Tax=Powellomyces hirtus TaxID=109895 RepID=A0A507DWE2_9FUNG|nr:hypothetical protein PhCBS80983_g05157 [Powellomyces hirtus]
MAVAKVPIELLDAIFRRLPDLPDLYSCCLVNHAWFNSAHAFVWKRVNGYSHEWQKYCKLLSKPKGLTVDYRTCIQEVTLVATTSDWEGSQDSEDMRRHSLVKILKFSPRLTILNLDFPAINDDDLWIISSSCRQLIALSIVAGVQTAGSVSDEGLSAVVRNCRNIKHLRLKSLRDASRDLGFTARGFRAVADGYRGQLKTFALGCAGMGIARLVHIDNEDDRRVKEALADILINNPDLDTLSLDWPIAVDDILQVAAENLKSLRTFRVGNAINTAAVSAILRNNLSLQAVSLNELSTLNSVTAFLDPLKNHPKLTHLTLDGIGFLNDVLPHIPSFHGLEHVQVTPSQRAASVHHHLTDDHVGQIVTACPNIKFLTIPIQMDMPLMLIAGNCANLVSLDICDGKDITDSAVMLLGRKCVNLETLHLGTTQNTRITDASLVVLAESLPRLQRLSLPFNATRVTFRTLAALAEHCKRLEGLSNVPAKVGYQALKIYLPKMERLVALSLSMGPGGWRDYLEKQEMEQLKASCKRLHQITHFA